MPDAAPARPSLDQALDEGLATLFGCLQAEAVPASLTRLVNRLEVAAQQARWPYESRTIA